MKQLLLFGCLLMIFRLNAQDDTRYLAGAVPTENGKVVFLRIFEYPNLSNDDLFELSKAWLDKLATDEDNRIVYADQNNGTLAFTGKKFLVFSSSALSLDRSLMSYRIIVECQNGLSTLTITGIRYEYNVSYQREPERYAAEEWITDDLALSKGKLMRIPGKFRKGTIDFAEETFEQYGNMLGQQSSPKIQKTNIIAQESATQPAASPQSTDPKEGFVAISAEQLPATIKDMLPASQLQLTAGTQNEGAVENVIWKGISQMFGKTVAQVAVPGDSPVYKFIGTGGVFTLSFLKNPEDQTPWLIMECSREGETVEGTVKTIIGEIRKIWIK